MLASAPHRDLLPSSDLALAVRAIAAAPAGPDRDKIVELMAAAGHAIVDRRCRPGHLTGSAMVLDDRGERCLLLLHAKLGRWLQPGGHADGDTNLASVALREATEETGIAGMSILATPLDVDVHEVQPPREDAHLHLDVRYLVVAPPGSQAVGNHESHELRWVPVDDLGGLDVDAGLLRLARRAVDAYRRLA